MPECGASLLGAALEVFASYRLRRSVDETRVAMTFESDIPYKLGLGGSSAIVIACLRALADHFEIEVAPEVMAELALVAERDLLGIPAGLQDRVVQCLGGVVYMDFDRRRRRPRIRRVRGARPRRFAAAVCRLSARSG